MQNYPIVTERREDIPLLADHFLTRFNRLQGKNVSGFSDEAMACLLSYNYPGNKGNRICSAKDLGIETTTLFRKISNFKIETPETDGRNRRR